MSSSNPWLDKFIRDSEQYAPMTIGTKGDKSPDEAPIVAIVAIVTGTFPSEASDYDPFGDLPPNETAYRAEWARWFNLLVQHKLAIGNLPAQKPDGSTIEHSHATRGVRFNFGEESMFGSSPRACLIGVWSSSWKVSQSEIVAVRTDDDDGRGSLAPLGMGVVTPATKLADILIGDELRRAAEEITNRRQRERSATPDF